MLKGEHCSEEAKRKMSEARKGIHLSEKTRKKISEEKLKNPVRYWLGKHLSEKTRKKLSEAHKNKWISPEYRKKLSDAHKGKHLSEETKRKISENHKGISPRGRGYKLPLWDKEKKSLAQRGEKHWRWKGGIATIRGSDWSWQRRMCYERDNWTCQICGVKCVGKSKENKKYVIQAHHKDLNPQNNSLSNLITLCRACHQKLHHQLLKQERSNK